MHSVHAVAHVVDIAKYILERQGRTSTMKLQKLVYYAQVWAVTDGPGPLFGDSIKAWAEGPVVPTLFHEHRGRAKITATDLPTSGRTIGSKDQIAIDRVLDFYGSRPAIYLSKLTHFEKPWRDARAHGARNGLASPVITLDAIRSFYAQRTPNELEADFQMHVASKIMDEHEDSLARLAQ